ncbi:MAG: hypothetical protein IIY21_28470 [Clostridiales bacterium]|nr:hypothetical protein [Clostridiales bacterium]MBQ1570388.1 hypothetical protein [Clostridiales bacterium]
MPFEDLIKNGITSSILTPESEIFLDINGDIVCEEKFDLIPPSSAWPNPEIELMPRELAETLLPDMTTVPMTDEEIDRFMKG